MVNTQEIKALMVRNNMTRQDLAKELGVSYSTVLSRLKDGNFTSNQIDVLIKVLHIEDPVSVFFSGLEVASDDT